MKICLIHNQIKMSSVQRGAHMEFKLQEKCFCCCFVIYFFYFLNVYHHIQSFKMTHFPLNRKSSLHGKDEI